MRLHEAITLFVNQLEVERSEATARGYHGALLQFCRYMHNPPIMQITPEHVVAYLKESIELGWKRNSLTAVSMALRKFFEYWGRKGYPVLNYQILPIIGKVGVEPKVANEENIAKLLQQCEGDRIYDVRNRAIIFLLKDTGMRNGELCSINMEALEKVEIDNGQYSCIIKTEKNRGSKPYRRVFWYEEANDALNKWLLLRAEFVRIYPPPDSSALFLGVGGLKWQSANIGHRVNPSVVGKMLKIYSQQAGIPIVNAHSLRHLFGNTAAEQGLNNSNISDLMGHASLSSSFTYTHLKDKQLAKVARKLKTKE